MKKRSKIAAGAGAALAVVGAGAAVAADRLTPKVESQAIVNDAAKQLGVDPAKLSAALEQALKNRIDAAVKDGRLTKAKEQQVLQDVQARIDDLVTGKLRFRFREDHGFGFGFRHFRGFDRQGPPPFDTAA